MRDFQIWFAHNDLHTKNGLLGRWAYVELLWAQEPLIFSMRGNCNECGGAVASSSTPVAENTWINLLIDNCRGGSFKIVSLLIPLFGQRTYSLNVYTPDSCGSKFRCIILPLNWKVVHYMWNIMAWVLPLSLHINSQIHLAQSTSIYHHIILKIYLHTQLGWSSRNLQWTVRNEKLLD